MKKSGETLHTISYLAGFFTIAAAMIMVVFLVMSLLGLLHPRMTRITLQTEDIYAVYDGEEHFGGDLHISSGRLNQGHRIEVRSIVRASRVGVYENVPAFVILDETGAEVTAQYDIQYDFGTLTIQPREIFLYCKGAEKPYDGQPVSPGELILTGGSLLDGHALRVEGNNELVYPGSVRAEPVYRVYAKDGSDVTDQYTFTEDFGQLVVVPPYICIWTGSAEKRYDGDPLTQDQWKLIDGDLLPGHSLKVRVTGALDDAGTADNTAEVTVLDENGLDVTKIYYIDFRLGTLEIHKLPLYLKTESAEKVYDGKPLICDSWTLTNGKLEEGSLISVTGTTQLDKIGTVENALSFAVTDKNGIDVSHRYDIICDYGTLTLQARAITIKTDSASKVFDGTELQCNTFQLISGELCEGETVVLVCTTITEIGYTQNFISSCVIYKDNGNGQMQDVTAYYRISYEYGSLEITAEK